VATRATGQTSAGEFLSFRVVSADASRVAGKGGRVVFVPMAAVLAQL
jgi:hypothetical protein